jgi:hypothetical protein
VLSSRGFQVQIEKYIVAFSIKTRNSLLWKATSAGCVEKRRLRPVLVDIVKDVMSYFSGISDYDGVEKAQ